MSTLFIYSLETLDWGCCGGRHYVGTVRWTDAKGEYPRHEIERKLSLREAKELDPDSGAGYWKSGIRRTTNRFDTVEQLERCATKWVEEHAEKAGLTDWLLINDDPHNPNRPIAGKGWVTTRFAAMRKMAKMWDGFDNAVRNALTKEEWKTIYRAWNSLLTP